jgi:hypothetical protein
LFASGSTNTLPGRRGLERKGYIIGRVLSSRALAGDSISKAMLEARQAAAQFERAIRGGPELADSERQPAGSIAALRAAVAAGETP